MDNKNKFFFQHKGFAGTAGASSQQVQNRENQNGESFIQVEDINIAGSPWQSDCKSISVSDGNNFFEKTRSERKLSAVNSYSFLNSKSRSKNEWYSDDVRKNNLINYDTFLPTGITPNMFVFYTSLSEPYLGSNKNNVETIKIAERNSTSSGNEMQAILSPLDQNLKNIAGENHLLKKQLLLTQKENNELKELNKSKNGLISIISHDLKNPFGALLNMSEFLATDVEDLDKHEVCDFAQTINVSAKILYKFFNDLLEWSKLQNGLVAANPVEIEVKTVVDEIFSLLNIIAVPKGIKLINKTTPEIKLRADLNMFTSILNNLVTNAIKFTNAGDIVVIESEEINGFVQIVVKDTGVGMGKKTLEKIFSIDKHITNSGTENEIGSGLGLVITKELITRQGGSIWVKSEEGKGTSFYFTLPTANVFSEVA
ncbi:MAG: HAMP domain-containing histidine kinase [Ignavibacteriaceae bacterium]|nr:HAMP domain-containing histidine kinase [Ignavibacteriaceae bacterium]